MLFNYKPPDISCAAQSKKKALIDVDDGIYVVAAYPKPVFYNTLILYRFLYMNACI